MRSGNNRIVNVVNKKLITFIAVLSILACNNYTATNQTLNNSRDTIRASKGTLKLLYDLSKPQQKIKLPYELQEISALSYYSENQLVCLQDEKADIFLIDYSTGDVSKKLESKTYGDYEGIEYVNQHLWLIRNDGELLEITNFGKPDEVKKVHELKKISVKNNVEGLGYDPEKKSLLLAFKDKAHLRKEEKLENKRCIYRFDLKKEKLVKKPYLTIDLIQLNKDFGIRDFRPSGIAYHPTEETFYIISAVSNSILVLTRKSEILHAEKLQKSIFRQPEGICFSPEGKKLFISNEGKNKKGNILVFNKVK